MKKKIIIFVGTIVIVLVGAFLYLYFCTNIIQNKIIPKTDTITIEYAPGMNIQEAEEKNSGEQPFIETQTIKLSAEEVKSLKKVLKTVKSSPSKPKEMNAIAKIHFTKNASLLINKKVGKLENKKETTNVTISNSLYNKINSYIEKNNKKVLETIPVEKFIIRKDGAAITLTNETNFEIVKEALPYYKVTIPDDYSTYDNGYQEIVIVNDTHVIYLYNNDIGYIRNNEEAFYVIFPYHLKEAVDSIYNKSIQ